MKKLLIFSGVILLAGFGAVVGRKMWTTEREGIANMRNRNVDVNNQRVIAHAMVQYARSHEGLLPKNLDVLIQENLLPEISTIYASPFEGKNEKKRNYRDSVYYIVPQGDSRKPYFYLRRHGADDLTQEDGYFEVNFDIDSGLKGISSGEKDSPSHSKGGASQE